MKRLHLIILTVLFMGFAMCAVLPACQKHDPGTTDTVDPAAPADVPAAAAPADDPAAVAPADDPAAAAPADVPAAVAPADVPAAVAPAIGAEITFGSYPQAGSEKEPLTWIVLDVDNAKHAVFLLSKYVIDAKPYHTERVPITWENCSLRAWLNGDFINTAFTTTEQDKILTTHLNNLSYNIYGKPNAPGGNDTDDKVFLLSLADVWHSDPKVPDSGKYFTSNAKESFDERKAFATMYAVNIGHYVDREYFKPNTGAYPPAPGEHVKNYNEVSCVHLGCAASWWLRSSGWCTSCATYVTNRGWVDTSGDFSDPVTPRVENSRIGVRPALWVQY